MASIMQIIETYASMLLGAMGKTLLLTLLLLQTAQRCFLSRLTARK